MAWIYGEPKCVRGMNGRVKIIHLKKWKIFELFLESLRLKLQANDAA